MFFRQVTTLLKKWRSAGEEVILFGDVNENVYKGRLARRFILEDIWLKEQVAACMGQRAPHSHIQGSTPVTGIWTTPEMKCLNIFCYPHGGGIGDHCFHVTGFCSKSVLGVNCPKTVQPDGQNLRCKVERSVEKYNKVLNQMLVRHAP